LFILELLNQKR